MKQTDISPAPAAKQKYVETPLMKQYYSVKAVHGDAILLFRVGDFYETFGEDAIKTAKILVLLLPGGQMGPLRTSSWPDFPTMR